jgi:hypothetical protein
MSSQRSLDLASTRHLITFQLQPSKSTRSSWSVQRTRIDRVGANSYSFILISIFRRVTRPSVGKFSFRSERGSKEFQKLTNSRPPRTVTRITAPAHDPFSISSITPAAMSSGLSRSEAVQLFPTRV